ncbi:MAG: S8 family serine peptidase [Candidatus Thorarchaeota archaeon]
MKTKFFAIVICISILTPGLFLFALPIQSTPIFTNSKDFISQQNEEYLLTDLGDLDISETDFDSLVPIQPYWYDLADKENVPNDGEGVYIAVLDTGLLQNWQDLFPEERIAWEYGKGFSYNAVWDDDLQDVVWSELVDDRGFITEYASGHGTHVTSTILGYNLFDYYWIEGIAPKATIIPVLCLDAWIIPTPYGDYYESGGTFEMVAAGIYYIADLSEELDGPVIINMSLGGTAPSQYLEDAIDYAINKGVIVVAAAGNRGTAQMDYPGAYDQVISCAACGWTEMLYQGWNADVPEELNVPDVFGNDYQVYLESFSGRPNADLDQKHKYLDVMCVGAWVVGPYKPLWSPPDYFSFYYVRGTSMATPHVSAIVALILELYPTFNQKDIEHILKIAANGVGQNMKRGFPKTGENVLVLDLYGYVYHSWGRFDYGAGFLQADEALIYATHYFEDCTCK